MMTLRWPIISLILRIIRIAVGRWWVGWQPNLVFVSQYYSEQYTT